MLTAQQFAVERGAPVAAESASCERTGATSSSRCRCSWPRTSTTPPTETDDGQERGVGERVELHGDDPEDPGTQYFALHVDEVPAVGGSGPDRLPAVSGSQEWVQRRTVEQTIDTVVPLPMLDALVPQTVVQLVEVLRPCDTVVPEQVIEAPKITLHDVIPQRAVLPMPQMAEQLVDDPVPSFDDFEKMKTMKNEKNEKSEKKREKESQMVKKRKKNEKKKNMDSHANPRRFPGFTVVVVTLFVKFLDEFHDFVSECVSSRGKSTTRFGR